MNTAYLTENTFLLPGGLVLQPNQSLNHAALRPLCGREEEWLACHQNTPSAIRVSWLLNACLLSLDEHPVNSDIVQKLLVGDRQYLMLQLRRLTLGDQIQAVVLCPACSQKMDVNFQLDDVPVKSCPQSVSPYSIEVSGRSICFRLPNGGDQEAILGHDIDDAVEELMQRCILDGESDALSSEERNVVVAAMEQMAPQVEFELDLTCPECSHQFLLPFDTTAFFFEEMAFKGKEILHEIHALAFYYHWSESDIVNLDRRRRRAYLALLSDFLSKVE